MAVEIQGKVFWVVMPCSVVVGYQHFRGPCCLQLQDKDEDGGSMDLQNVGVLPKPYMMSQPRGPQIELADIVYSY